MLLMLLLDASSEWKRNLKAKGIEAFSKRNRISIEAFVYNPREAFNVFLAFLLIVIRSFLNNKLFWIFGFFVFSCLLIVGEVDVSVI